MPRKRKGKVLSMRKIREVLRLTLGTQMSNRQIGHSVSISHVTVAMYRRGAEEAGISHCDVEKMGDLELRGLIAMLGSDQCKYLKCNEKFKIIALIFTCSFSLFRLRTNVSLCLGFHRPFSSQICHRRIKQEILDQKGSDCYAAHFKIRSISGYFSGAMPSF